MDETLRQRIRKLESGNKKNSIENRRLAREVMDLTTRLEKLEAELPANAAVVKANEKMVKRLHGAMVNVVQAIKKLRQRVPRKPAPPTPKRKKAAAKRPARRKPAATKGAR